MSFTALATTGLPLLATSGVPLIGYIDTGEFDGLQSPVSSLAYRGVTINLSTPLPYFFSANGDPVFYTGDSASTVTSISPASAVDGNGRRHSGAMINPDPTVELQGYDELMGVDPKPEVYAYSSGLNGDPAASGSPIVIAQGASFSLKKQVRGTPDGSLWKCTDRYVVFTFMGALPEISGTWFRPALSTTTKTYPGRVEDINWSALRDLAAPSGLSSATTYLAEISSQKIHTLAIEHGPYHGRRLQLLGEAGVNGYSRDYGRTRGKYACALHVDPGADETDRRELAKILCQWGIDVDGSKQRGNSYGAGAGHSQGFIEFAYIAAFLLNDSDMLARVQATGASTPGQFFWVRENRIGYPNHWDWGTTSGTSKIAGEAYQDTELNVPEWAITGASPLAESSNNLHASYRDVSIDNLIYEAMSIALLQNGPGGTTGDAALRNGPNNTTNDRAAAVAYMDRQRTLDPWEYNVGGLSNTAKAVYDDWRDAFVATSPKWTGRPDVPANPVDEPLSGARQIAAGSSAGEIDFRFDWMPLDYSTLAVTAREVQVSQDNKHFVALSAISTVGGDSPGVGGAATGTITGLRSGTVHYVRWRQQNSAGWSRWTASWEMALASGTEGAQYKAPRNRVTTLGTASGTLTNRVAPVICHKPYAAHEMPLFEPVTDAAAVMDFFAGIGYWTGGTGALSPSYLWQRNTGGGFANIPGATAQQYTRTSADDDSDLRCQVTVNGSTLATNTVTIPAPSPTAGAVIDLDFSPSTLFDWPTFITALNAADAAAAAFSLDYYPYAQLSEDVSQGCLHVKKEAANPTLTVTVATNVPVGNYTWEVEFGGGHFPVHDTDFNTSTATYNLELRTGGGAVRGDADIAVSRAPGTTPMAVYSGTFTVSSGDRTVVLWINCPTGSGGVGGAAGGPVLARLTILPA